MRYLPYKRKKRAEWGVGIREEREREREKGEENLRFFTEMLGNKW